MKSKAEKSLYEEVLEMINEGSHGEVPDFQDDNFNDVTYRIGMSARRTANALHWINGRSIALHSDLGDGEISFLQNCSYDMACLII